MDRYQVNGTRYLESRTVRGKLIGDKVTGSIEGTTKRTKPNGRVVRCTFGPLGWSAAD